MTRVIAVVVLLCVAATSASAKSTRGYVKKDGTYVQPHQKTDPNKTKGDNYSTKGNTSPYTGKKGTKPRNGEAPPAKP